jgi:hypothetical protein
MSAGPVKKWRARCTSTTCMFVVNGEGPCIQEAYNHSTAHMVAHRSGPCSEDPKARIAIEQRRGRAWREATPCQP